MRRPNTFVVGAAKSGTTALWVYLREHPEVYMCPVKEPHYFCDDLGIRDEHDGTLASYLELFSGAGDEPVVGEASPTYLLSSVAARRIREFDPGARIVIVLRDPVRMVAALHRQLRLASLEPHPDLADALAASEERELPDPPDRLVWLDYRRAVSLAEQVARYLDTFPRHQVHVLLQEDLRDDPSGTYRRLLDFLGVGTSHRPEFRLVNPSKEARFPRLQRVLVHPGRPIERALHRVVPGAVIDRAARANLRRSSYRLDPELERRLRNELRPEIEQLAVLIGRDLSHWC